MKVSDKEFKLYLSKEKIQERVAEVASLINADVLAINSSGLRLK